MKKLLINGEVLEHTGPIEWGDNLEDIANTISFSSDEQIAPGSQFVLMDDTTHVMSGIVSDYTQNKANEFVYAGYDFGFYLNKNSIIKQFNSMKISDAFNKLCSEFNIPVGEIPSMSTTVKKIYKGVNLSDVFKEFLELHTAKTGADYYYFTCRDGSFSVKKYEINEDLRGVVNDIMAIKSTDTLMSPSISVSMAELKNQIIVTDNSSDKISKLVKVNDAQSIAKYGLLQHVESVDTNKSNNLAGVAQNKLNELNQLQTTIDLTMLGNCEMHKGVIMPINNDELGLSGDYLIKSSRHNIDSVKEVVTVSLVRYNRSKL